ncbi:MAG TPA: DUF4012 domain-containing protein [bacterium]|nr:DUF4012 domain-containing protein [bacterium]
MIHTVNRIDPEYIPESLIGDDRKDQIVQALETSQFVETELIYNSEKFKRTLEYLPDILGSERPVTVLVVFQNEKEMRASGGLLSAYAIMTIDKGEIVGNIKSIDMWELQLYLWQIGQMPGYYNEHGQLALMLNGCGTSEMRVQDSGVYPDQQLSMKMFTDYYNLANRSNKKKYPDYDYVVTMNTFFASDMISLVEPIKLKSGQVITSDNMAKEIFSRTNVKFNNPDPNRKYAIGEVATLAKEKFKDIPATEFPNVIKTLIDTINEKNISFYARDENLTKYFDDIGVTHRTVNNFEGDYFQLSEAQNCALKANFYIYNDVLMKIDIDDKGKITRSVRVKWYNKEVVNRAEREILDVSGSFRYRAWIRFFAPKDTKFTYSDGFAKSLYLYKPKSYYDKKMMKETYDNVIYFDHRRWSANHPVVTHELNVKYELPSRLNFNEDEGYQLLLQKHPGKKDEKYTIEINHKGKKVKETFRLDKDKILTFKDGEIHIEDYPSKLDDYYNLMSSIEEIIDN